MSKELTPLEAFEKIKGITSTYEMGAYCKLGKDPYYGVEVRTIEKALIENATLNYLLRGVTYTFEKEDFTLEQLGKKLKALEIIKEHVVFREDNVLEANFKWLIKDIEMQNILREVLK